MAVVLQSGGIVFRIKDREPYILLVRARQTPTAWIFPKGHVEFGETAAAAALREVHEESGVEGVVLLQLHPALEFQSGTESVRVRYFLIAATHETESNESRDKCWFPPEQALAELTHIDARRLLRAALPIIDERAGRSATREIDSPFHELLLAEYHHVADSLIRNEEDGEKRVTFLISLAGGVAAAVGFILGKDGVPSPAERNPFVLLSLMALFALGYLTLVRVVTRNLATDRYKRGLSRIRRYFLESELDPRTRFLAFNPYEENARKLSSWKSVGRGGWLPTVVLVDSFFLGAIAMVITASGSWWANAAVGVAIGSLAWIALIRLANRKYTLGVGEERDMNVRDNDAGTW